MRTTICRARSFKLAQVRFLREFADYARDGISFLNEWEVFEIDGDPGNLPIETRFIGSVTGQDLAKTGDGPTRGVISTANTALVTIATPSEKDDFGKAQRKSESLMT